MTETTKKDNDDKELKSMCKVILNQISHFEKCHVEYALEKYEYLSIKHHLEIADNVDDYLKKMRADLHTKSFMDSKELHQLAKISPEKKNFRGK